MTANSTGTLSCKIPTPSILTLVQHCLEAEESRSLSANSIKELRRYLKEFTTYCREQELTSVNGLTAVFLKTYAEQRCEGKSPVLKKAVVWALRKFGNYLALIQVVEKNPAQDLRHPKMHPRSQLPRYLSQKELTLLLKYSAFHLNQRDFLIILLLASTGLRPNEIVLLKQSDIHLDQRRLDLHVKGGWRKKTPLCKSMTNLLADYLSTINDSDSAVFMNNKARPVTVSWIQRLVKCTGRDAGLSLSLTCNHLRHTFATYAADRHGKVITKALMGHQRLTTTEIYTHLSPSYFRPLAQGHPFQNETGGESHE